MFVITWPRAYFIFKFSFLIYLSECFRCNFWRQSIEILISSNMSTQILVPWKYCNHWARVRSVHLVWGEREREREQRAHKKFAESKWLSKFPPRPNVKHKWRFAKLMNFYRFWTSEHWRANKILTTSTRIQKYHLAARGLRFQMRLKTTSTLKKCY